MAHQTGIHGEGGWRAGRGQRVSTRRCAPSPAPGSSRASARGSFLFSFAAARRLGWHIWGRRTHCAELGVGVHVGPQLGRKFPCWVCPRGMDVPVCAHLWVCVPFWGWVHPDAHVWGSVHACSLALCVQPCVRPYTYTWGCTYTSGCLNGHSNMGPSVDFTVS